MRRLAPPGRGINKQVDHWFHHFENVPISPNLGFGSGALPYLVASLLFGPGGEPQRLTPRYGTEGGPTGPSWIRISPR